MCMQPNQVRPYQKWHWAGDEIVHDTVIPASRTVAGTREKWYPIDIREYLSTEDNAVVRLKIREIMDGLSPAEQAQFLSIRSGSFDFRTDKVIEYVSRLKYEPVGRHFDQWLFPDETLHMEGGDCEDLAFVLAALLEASGISSYCIRVALGAITHYPHDGPPERTDHAWVTYLNEAGSWEILEPLAITGKKQKQSPGERVPHTLSDIEYTPYFVFNRQHLWRVRGPDSRATKGIANYLGSREFWKEFRPLFAVKVHEGIYDEALAGISTSDLALIKRASLIADANVLGYDPRDHFDFAYIAEGWDRVATRLKTGKLHDFAYAIHAIADFYAHSVYPDFAGQDGSENLLLYDPAQPNLPKSPVYDFSRYAPLPGCRTDVNQAAAAWNTKLISGQWWRWYSTFPDELKDSPGFGIRRCLPDHDLLAVDSPTPRDVQRHYSASEYPKQFLLRRKAAVAHIRKVYSEWHRVD